MAKVGIATIALRRYDLHKALDLSAQAGFEGVEIWGRPPHTPEVFERQYWEIVREKLQELELGISMFGSYINPAWQDYKEKVSISLLASKVLGAKMLRVWAGNAEPKDASEDLWQHTIKAYKDLCKKAADQGLSLAIEMHPGTLCVSPEGSLRMLDEVGASNLKLNYQVAYPAHADLEHDIALAGPHIVNVHAQNFNPSEEEDGKYELSLIEEGVIDYRRLLELLQPHGFDGYVEVEFLKGEFTSEETMLDSLKQDAAYLRKLKS